MLHMIALALVLAAPDPAAETVVRGLSVMPSADRTEVVIDIDGDVTYRDMLITDPNRLVIDFQGARHAGGLQRFDGIDRGGVRNLRVGQFEPGVVRVVVELDGPVSYRLERAAGELRVSFPNTAGTFQPWRSPGGGPAVSRTGAAPIGTPVGAPLNGEPRAPVMQPRPAQQQAAQQQVVQPRAQPQRPPLTVNFVEVPLSDVLATIGDYAGRTIIASQGVRARTITAEIRAQPWDLALSAILAANGLFLREHPQSGILIVDDTRGAAEQREAEPLMMRQFPIRFVPADSLVLPVRGMITDKGRVTVSSSSNTLLITESATVLDQVEPIIAQLDVRPPQVNISATIAFIDRTALEQYGVVYDLKDSRGNQINRLVSGWADLDGTGVLQPTQENVVMLGGNSIAALANANYRVPSPALELVVSLVLGRHTLVTFLEALQTVQLSDIQAKPVVQTMNHRQAVIQVGESTPIRVIDAGAGTIGGTATVQWRDTGIILRVTPHITGDQVLLDLHAERSNIAVAPSDIGFTFATQQAQTQVLVADGETAVIGGLTITEKSRVRAGIPLLMNLPVIGPLFRQTTERENKRDLLIMVTPHIID